MKSIQCDSFSFTFQAMAFKSADPRAHVTSKECEMRQAKR